MLCRCFYTWRWNDIHHRQQKSTDTRPSLIFGENITLSFWTKFYLIKITAELSILSLIKEEEEGYILTVCENCDSWLEYRLVSYSLHTSILLLLKILWIVSVIDRSFQSTGWGMVASRWGMVTQQCVISGGIVVESWTVEMDNFIQWCSLVYKHSSWSLFSWLKYSGCLVNWTNLLQYYYKNYFYAM